jgi:hypothetical protein
MPATVDGVCSMHDARLRGRVVPAVLAPEPPPKPSEGVAVWELVVTDVLLAGNLAPGVRDKLAADMEARDQQGRAKYGTPLQAFNGRDALVDAYQEALDLCVYLRQKLEEIGGVNRTPAIGEREPWTVNDEYRHALAIAATLRRLLP